MSIVKRIQADERIQAIYKAYMNHPFIQGMARGDLDREKFRFYLIQDSLYLKDYGKVYASVFMAMNRIEDLQFLHSCIGVVTAHETNMHTQYLKDYGLDVYKVDNDPVAPENRAYLDYMLSFTGGHDPKKTFMSALPCTLTYEYIGKTLKTMVGDGLKDNYFGPWIEAYAGEEFETFSVKSCELIDRLCADCTEEEITALIDIYLKACEYELAFWDMSQKGTL